MPIPNPKSGEQEKEYISRCISKIIDEYEQKQAAAICYSKYREKMSKDEQEEMFVLQPRKNENRGMYLKRCASNTKIKLQKKNLKERLGFCMSSFNEYYKYWSKIEMSDIPEDTVLGECIAVNKSRGFDYRESYQRCSSKLGNKPLTSGESISLGYDNNLIIEPVEFSEVEIRCIENHVIAGFPPEKSKEFCKSRSLK